MKLKTWLAMMAVLRIRVQMIIAIIVTGSVGFVAYVVLAKHYQAPSWSYWFVPIAMGLYALMHRLAFPADYPYWYPLFRADRAMLEKAKEVMGRTYAKQELLPVLLKSSYATALGLRHGAISYSRADVPEGPVLETIHRSYHGRVKRTIDEYLSKQAGELSKLADLIWDVD